MKYCFGPVPSRRLGRSLGVDILPMKTCNLNCVYCELGITEKFTCDRAEYIPVEEIKRDIETVFRAGKHPFDVLTFTASGEPCLHSCLGELISFAKSLSGKPIVVLTNGTLTPDPAVRHDLCQADILLPSLDAVLPRAFRKVNRPAECVDVSAIVQGLTDMSMQFKGEMWLEVLIVEGLNDSPEDIRALKEAVDQIRPHRIQLNSVARPPAEPWARPLSRDRMEEIRKFLGNRAEVIVDFNRRLREGFMPVVEVEIMETLRRRPMTAHDISEILGIDPKTVETVLDKMRNAAMIREENFQGRTYYRPGRPAAMAKE